MRLRQDIAESPLKRRRDEDDTKTVDVGDFPVPQATARDCADQAATQSGSGGGGGREQQTTLMQHHPLE